MKYLVKFTDSNIQNIILNICILLFGINFLYKCNYIVFGTFVLLFIFKRFKIKLGNVITLAILSLFALSWFIFSDGHEISGICLPICYLIGCNINENEEKGITKFILLISISLALYTTLFFINNAITNGITNYDVLNQPNIWTGRPLWATNIMMYSALFYSCFGYLLFEEKSRILRVFCLLVFIVNAFYALMLSRRAALLMIIISLCISTIFKLFVGEKADRRKTIILSLSTIGISIGVLIVLAILYKFNVFGFKNMIMKTDLYIRFIGPMSFSRLFNDMGRLVFTQRFIEHMAEYPFGGCFLREIAGNYAHDLWLDVYDVAGIVPTLFIVVFTAIYLIKMFRIFLNRNLNSGFRMLVICILACSIAQFSIEPVMEACKSYIYAICMIFGSLECIKEKNNV